MMRSRSALFTSTIAALALAVGPAGTAAGDSPGGGRELTLPKAGQPLEDVAGVADARPAAGLARAVGDVLAGRDVRVAKSLTAQSTVAGIATTPTIDSPAPGQTVGGGLTVSVSSGAPQVRIAGLGVNELVPVSSGAASLTVPTWGWSGQQIITAADCDDTGCGTPAKVTVTVSNTAPTMARPTAGAVVGTSFTAAATSAGVSVKFTLDGRPAGVADTAAPFEQVLYTDALAAGQHTVAAVQCDAAGKQCDLEHPSAGVTVTVRQHLYPSIARVAPDPFSPGRDGRRDTATVTYTLDTTQTVTWRVTNTAGTTVVPARRLGTKAAGTYQFTFNGKRPDGRYLPTGRYTVHLDTAQPVTGGTITGHAMRTVTLDRTKPRVRYVSAAPGTVYPVRDRYKDTTRLKGRLSERVASAVVRIYNSNGKTVRKLRIGGHPAGPVAVRWNGRRASGALVEAGNYRYRFFLQDGAGNRSASGKATVAVSHKRLVRKSGSKTVTAKGSAVKVYEGDCSEVISPGVRGWAKSVGYYSNVYYTDPDYYGCWYGTSYALAAVDHATTLPSAARYGSMRISANGGKAMDEYNDRGVLLYYTGDGDLSDEGSVLGAAVGNHSGPTVDRSFISLRGRVRWNAGTINGNFYDIKSFTVHYTYFVLR